MPSQLSQRIEELTRSRTPFVQATVVRAQAPSSARAGDRAIVLADGSVEGFVGGDCATGSVRTAALGALETGEGLLLRVLPGGEDAFPEAAGASVVVNPCLSGGALEIYLEPLLPLPALHLVGGSPTAEAVAALAPALGFVVQRSSAGAGPAGSVAAVVSSHGGDEVGAVRAALAAGVGFVGVVCSHTRGAALLDQLDLSDAERRRVHVHVGVDIGARTAPEIALSILAAVVRAVRLEGLVAAPPATASASAPLSSSGGSAQSVDPVCGMTVTVAADTPHLFLDGADQWFCNPACRDAYAGSRAVSPAS